MKQRLGVDIIAMRVAKELQDGQVVNLGVGIGTLVSNYVPDDKVIFHAENAVFGYGRVLTAGEEELMDWDLINAGLQFVAPLPGMSLGTCADAFGMVRSGRVDVTVVGALQVSEKGDLANWTTNPQATARIGALGGAMDMVSGAKRVIAPMLHTDKAGNPKILKQCTLPLTGKECVDLIVTDIAVIEVTKRGLLLREVAPGWTAREVQDLTEPKLIISDDLKEIEL